MAIKKESSDGSDVARVVWVFEGVETVRDLAPTHAVYVFGRSSRADVRISDDRASRHHAELYWEGHRWWIRDSGSRNGTRVGLVRISRPVPLNHGDSIQCGDTTISFLWPASLRGGAASSQPDTVAAPPVPALSQVDLELLRVLCSPYATGSDPRADGAPQPLGNAEIAAYLHLSEDGVRQRLKRLYPKFGLKGTDAAKRRELAALAIETGAIGGSRH